jgi:hypothetical protein
MAAGGVPLPGEVNRNTWSAFTFTAGRTRLFARHRAEVLCPRIGNHPTRIVARRQATLDGLVEPEPLGTGDLQAAIQRGAHRDRGDRSGHVIGGHRLERDGRHVNLIAGGRGVGDSVDELEELRRAHDRVRDRSRCDQLLLRDLGLEIAVVRRPIDADDR